jgi:hypothetical protein
MTNPRKKRGGKRIDKSQEQEDQEEDDELITYCNTYRPCQ